MPKSYLTLLLWSVALHGMSQMDYQLQIVKAQFKERSVLPPSPDASSLGVYGNVPVSMYTGIPDISFPLLEMKGKFLTLPVSLSYYSAGFRPEDIASWVGLYWSLNAGGVITRAVSGAPDLESNYFKSPSPIREPNDLNAFDRAIYLRDISDGFLETQPDMYCFNFMGRSGKFFITSTGAVISKEKSMMIIRWDRYADEFVVTDESGNLYVFSQREQSTTVPSDDIGALPTAYRFTSSWYLSSVTSADGTEKLLFEYHTPSAPQPTYTGAVQQQSKTWAYITSSCPRISPSTEMSRNNSTPMPVYITRKFLKKVRLVRGAVDIAYTDFESLADRRQDLWQADFSGERMLSSVRSYRYLNGAPVPVKYFRFSHSYFQSTEASFGGLRLRLDKVQEMSLKPGTADMPAWAFTYNDGNLPRRYSFGLDHWGFYNGANQQSLLPSVTASIDGSTKTYGDDANREPDFKYSSLALIKKITYPTRGYTVFDFEANAGAGGVRIRKISDYSFEGVVARSKIWKYDLASTRGVPKYTRMAYYNSTTQGCVGSLCNCPSMGRKSVTISSTSVYSLGYMNGASVVYGQVTEYIADANEEVAGYTVTNFETGVNLEADDDIRSGAVRQQQFYANGGILIKQIDYQYQYHESRVVNGLYVAPEENQDNKSRMCEKKVNGRLEVEFHIDLSGKSCLRTATINTRFRHYDISVRQQWFPLVGQTVKQFHPASGNMLVTTKKFSYGNNHLNPVLIEEQSSENGEIIGTLIKTIADYSYKPGNDPVVTNLRTAASRNIRLPEVERLQYRENADGTNRRFIGGQLTTYFANGLPQTVFLLETERPIVNITPASFSGVFKFSPQFRMAGTFRYDAESNLVEQGRAGDITTAYLWDYHSAFPVAVITNALQNQVAYTGFETSQSGGWSIAGTYSTSTLSLAGTRSIRLGASTTISKAFGEAVPHKQVVSYWSRGGSITVKANGAGVAAIKGAVRRGWSYFEHISPAGTTIVQMTGAGETIDELRTYPFNSAMTTYQYDMANGVTEVCGPDNRVVYYEYDGLGRLTNTRDSDGNITRAYAYNYGTGTPIVEPAMVFHNAERKGDFTKNVGCPAGSFPTTETYTVEAGKHVALTQAEADQLAEQDLVKNGQDFVNRTGRCFWKSAARQKTIYKQCEYYQGEAIPLIVYSDAVISYISQEDADQKAALSLNKYDQNYANRVGKCRCEDEGKRYLGGPKCATGIKTYYSYQWEPAMRKYKCTYYYTFSDGSISQRYYEYSPTPCYAR